MADVFISYSKQDRAIAEALATDLAATGFDVWWDFELYAGDDFHDMIRAEIAKAKAVIVIWSEPAVASRWVRGEAVEADHHGSLISTHAPGFDPRKVPINFLALHCEPVVNRPRVIAAIEKRGAKRSAKPATPKDPLTDLRERAARGEAYAQSALGAAYDNGTHGLAKDDREAVRLYKLAAEQGDAVAQINLGIMHGTGRGDLPKDDREAVRLFKLAAEQGDAAAQSNLGFMHEQGRGGLTKDDREAVRLYRLAAEQGHPAAQFNLGTMYANGRGGLPKDLAEAVRLYKLAADQGDAEAIAALKRRKVVP